MQETEPSPPSESEKLAATLAALEAERTARQTAGKWSRGPTPCLRAIQSIGMTEDEALQCALREHLAEHPDAPKSMSAYDWILIRIVAPKPTIELPAEQTEPVVDAIDVTPAMPPSRQIAQTVADVWDYDIDYGRDRRRYP
jgi:hypothetical protein